MAKREQNPPHLARGGATQIELSRNANDDSLPVRAGGTPSSTFAVIALKASIGLATKPCVSGVGYMVASEEQKSFSCGDISSCVVLVPIRDDPEMVLNLGLRVAEAGLQRLGVAA